MGNSGGEGESAVMEEKGMGGEGGNGSKGEVESESGVKATEPDKVPTRTRQE